MTALEVKPTQPTTSLRSQLSQLERWRKVRVNALLVTMYPLVSRLWVSPVNASYAETCQRLEKC